MAIEESPPGAIIITGKQDINTFALTALIHAFALEINHGMKASRIPAIQGAKNLGVIPQDEPGKPKKRWKKPEVLRLTVEKLQEARPEYSPSESITKAMGS